MSRRRRDPAEARAVHLFAGMEGEAQVRVGRHGRHLAVPLLIGGARVAHGPRFRHECTCMREFIGFGDHPSPMIREFIGVCSHLAVAHGQSPWAVPMDTAPGQCGSAHG